MIVVVYMVLNGTSMYFLGKILKINRVIAFGMGVAWAFCAYTRARAKVHMGLVGIFHLPLVFIGLYLIYKKKDLKSFFFATICFFIASTMSFYYVVTLVFLAPFFVGFAYISSENKSTLFNGTKRLMIALLPAITWLLLSVTHPVPKVFISDKSPFPNTGQPPVGYIYHPFLDWFGSHPIDFFTGDVGNGIQDNNPLREKLNEHVYNNPLNSNAHERANGIRWSLWILSLTGLLFSVFKTKFYKDSKDKTLIVYFMIFGTFNFLLSMSPMTGHYQFSPSFWIYKFVSQIRVPNRAGIGVHFATIIISGIFIKNLLLKMGKSSKKKLLILVFPLIILLDFPPMNLMMPISPILSTYKDLENEKSNCGYGIQFPYSSSQIAQLHFNYFIQRMRNNNCLIVNSSEENLVDLYLIRNFGLTKPFVMNLEGGDFSKIKELKSFIECAPLNWIVFHEALSNKTQIKICSQIGWRLLDQGVCLPSQKLKIDTIFPDKCLGKN
jgi:hypothetical protein